MFLSEVSRYHYISKNCDQDIKRQMRKFYDNVNMLLRRFSKRSTPVKCYLFQIYCSNLYCASLSYNFTVTAMKKLDTAYNNIILLTNIIVLVKWVYVYTLCLLASCREKNIYIAFVLG